MPTGSTLPLSPRPGAARLIVGYGAVACAVPYLALKITWISGGQLGVADPAVMHDQSLAALNIMTAFMDVVAIAMALAFTHKWGLRVPAWLVLPPMWVASGLLVRFVLGVPVAAIAQVLGSQALHDLEGPVQPWVYAAVYTGFMGMGLGLIVAFVLYARTRWSTAFRTSGQAARLDATRLVERALANMAATMAAGVAALHLAWALGATIGLSPELMARRVFSSYALNALDSAIAVGAAVGILVLVHGPVARIPFRVALTLTWIGGGYLFAWGLWHLLNVLGETALVRESARGMALVNLLGLFRFVAGLLIGVLMLLVVAERPNPVETAGIGRSEAERVRS